MVISFHTLNFTCPSWFLNHRYRPMLKYHDNINKFCKLVSDEVMFKKLIFLQFSKADRDIDRHYDYKIFFYTLKNNSSITLFTICVYDCMINIYAIHFIFLQCSKAKIWSPYSKYYKMSYKSQNHSSVTIWYNFLCLKLKQSCQTTTSEHVLNDIEL